MGPVEALEVALRKEESSIEFYKNMQMRYTELKELFDFLVNEEYKHQKMIKEKIQQMTRY